MVIDIRKSSSINDYLTEYHGNQAIFSFYKKFKNVCDGIAVKEHKAIFNKQVGDRVDYAWKHQKDKDAIDTAISISNQVTQIMDLQTGIPVSIGVGICFGEGIFDYEENEIKADSPRIAFLLQEGRYGIFLKKKPCYIPDGYSAIKNIINCRGCLYNSYQIVSKKQVQAQKKQSQSNLKRYTRGIFQDTHLHLEGINLSTPIFNKIIHDSIDDIKNNKNKKLVFRHVTKTHIDKIPSHNYCHVSMDTKDNKPQTFDTFLHQLYLAKCCLCSNEDNAARFVRETLRLISHQTTTFTIGITPSIPSDFPYLNQSLWFEGITQEIKKCTRNNLSSTPPLIVIETKRRHLLNNVYLENLKFLDHLRNVCPNINIAIGLCDDAAKFPLATTSAQKKYVDYVNRAKEIDPNVQVQVHEMEQYWTKEPLKELLFLIDFFDKAEVYKVKWIHMSYLNPSAKVVTQKTVTKLLNHFQRRDDQIVACYSSNKYLGTPFILDHPLVISYLLDEKIKISLGTDDPSPFNIESIHDEFVKVKRHLLEIGTKYTDVQTVMEILAQNSIR